MIKKMSQWVTLFGLVITLAFSFPAPLKASPAFTRLAGEDRYLTATAIAKYGWTQADYAVLAYGENYPDALSAAPLAKKYDAPILLTDTQQLPATTKEALGSLKVKNVMIVGGTGVVSTAVEAELQAMGIHVSRYAGQDRYETSVQIARQVTEAPSTLFIAYGEDYPDALSIAPIAAMKQMPVILVPRDFLPDSLKGYISAAKVTKTYVLGNSQMIEDGVFDQFPNPERIVGDDKYQRNVAVNRKFSDQFQGDGVCHATGEGFADALTGSAYAAKIGKPILLIKGDSPVQTKDYLKEKAGSSQNLLVTLFGGNGVIPGEMILGLYENVAVQPALPGNNQVNVPTALPVTPPANSETTATNPPVDQTSPIPNPPVPSAPITPPVTTNPIVSAPTPVLPVPVVDASLPSFTLTTTESPLLGTKIVTVYLDTSDKTKYAVTVEGTALSYSQAKAVHIGVVETDKSTETLKATTVIRLKN